MSVRVAAGTKYLAGRPAADVIALARQQGADGVELGPGHLDLAGQNLGGQFASLAHLLEVDRLMLAGIALPDLSFTRDDELAAAVSSLCEQVGSAGRLGVRAVHLAAGDRKSFSMDALIRSLARLLPIAEASRVRVHVANRLGSRIEQIEDLRHLLAALKHPALCLRMDVGDLYAAAVNPRDVFAEFGEVVGSIFLSDRVGRQDVPLGTGRVNLKRLLADVAEAHYDGWLVVNLKPGGPGESAGLSPVEYVRGLLSERTRGKGR
jgi:sugar phosphate isomerase/epimerase